MIKKITCYIIIYMLIIILGIIVLLNYKKDNTNTDEVLINQDDNIDRIFYDSFNSIDYKTLFYYLSFNTEYKNVPVTDNYKTKFKSNLSQLYNFEKYNFEIYNYDVSDLNQMEMHIEFDWQKENSFIVELILFNIPNVNPNYWYVNKRLYFDYTVDKNGYVDDIIFINEEVYREDDGTPIIKSNNRKFDVPENIARYLENLVYGVDFIKYKNERDWIYYDCDIKNVEWEMKEYALTDNFKKHYNIKKGLLTDELKQQAYKNEKDITMYYPKEISMYYSKFPKEKTSMLPIRLYYDGIYYNYNLSYSITDDYFLDELKLDEIQ